MDSSSHSHRPFLQQRQTIDEQKKELILDGLARRQSAVVERLVEIDNHLDDLRSHLLGQSTPPEASSDKPEEVVCVTERLKRLTDECEEQISRLEIQIASLQEL